MKRFIIISFSFLPFSKLCRLSFAILTLEELEFCLTVRLLLPGSLKQNWPIRLQDKNNEFQPKPIEPITSRRKPTVETQNFGIIYCSYPTVIWLASF